MAYDLMSHIINSKKGRKKETSCYLAKIFMVEMEISTTDKYRLSIGRLCWHHTVQFHSKF